jgi:serine O-acetyltransferase
MMTMNTVSNATDNVTELMRYTQQQLQFCSPGNAETDVILLARHLPQALERLSPILRYTTISGDGKFNHLNALQNATYLYLVANEIWRHEGVNPTSERLFLLNRSLNSLDIYYKIRLPRVFVISHGLGAVLGDTQYGDNFVFFQNTTVGRLGNARPTIGRNVILFPGSAVLGDSIIGSNCVISAGTIVNNRNIPNDSIVFPGPGGIAMKPRKKDYISLYIRNEALTQCALSIEDQDN